MDKANDQALVFAGPSMDGWALNLISISTAVTDDIKTEKLELD